MSQHVRTVDPGHVDRDGLEQAERVADKVVLTAQDRDPAWREFCLRVADRVVLVSSDRLPPQELPARGHGCDLVLTGPVRSAEERRAWFAALEPKSTHVVDEANAATELRALAARLTGRSLGLVLGGGGARGFAHLGVLEVLEENGIHVDRVAGTSMGAVVAAGKAAWITADVVDANIYEFFVRNNPLGDYTLPVKGIIRGRRTVLGLEAGFLGLNIEDLPMEFRCVSVDILNRRKKVHDRGPLAAAVGASLRIPGLFPPLVHDGSLHVDGGVLDNLPVTSLSRGEGPLLAVNIGFGADPLMGALGDPPIPGMGDTLMRTLMMASGNAADEAMGLADLVLRPDASGVGMLEWHQIDRMRESGRATTEAALPQILELVSR
jgi:predicted acylesterase/phospholipase RssA